MTDRVETAVPPRVGRPASARTFSARTVLGRYGTLIALAALLLFNIAVTPNFLHLQTLYVNLTQVSTIAIVAIGMTLVIATGGIDLSVGAMMALAGALAPLIFLSDFGRAYPEIGLAAAISLPILAAALGGAFNGVLVSAFGIQPIVATLILFISGRGIAQVLTNGNLQTFSNPGFTFLGTGRILGVPTQALIAILLAFAAAWLVSRTVYGRYLLAIGGNARAARLSGVPVRTVTIATYMLCSALAGVAGLVVSAINSASDANQTGQLMELDAIAAAVVGGAVLSGGRAPVLGALLGAVIIQLVRYTLLANGVPDALALVAKAAIIIGAVYIQQGRKE